MDISSVAAILLPALAVGMALGWALTRAAAAAALARVSAQRDGLAERLRALEAARAEDDTAASALAPLRQTLGRVAEQVTALERDRVEHFGEVGARLGEVVAQTRALQQETAQLSGALHSSAVRGTWGEAQLRRVLEHAGMLQRCDFDEQVSATTRHDARVRPDVVVHLPGEKELVIDAKAPMGAFLRAQADDLDGADRAAALRAHAAAVRVHVEALAAKEYWSAFTTSPELVVCFVPSDAVLASALQAEPDLYDHAQSRKVVLASPATLLAVLRATALAWQQDALTGHARDVLQLGTELHQRLGTLGRHVGATGGALRRAVESYNAMVGTLETRVMVTSRRMSELGVVEQAHQPLRPVEAAPRPLTAAELIDDELGQVSMPRPMLLDDRTDSDGRGERRRGGGSAG